VNAFYHSLGISFSTTFKMFKVKNNNYAGKLNHCNQTIRCQIIRDYT